MASKLRKHRSGSPASSAQDQYTGRSMPAGLRKRRSATHPDKDQKSIRRAREHSARKRSIALLSDLKYGKASYSKLLRDYHLDTRTAHKYLGAALRIGPSGRVHASKSDRLTRELLFPTASGDIPMRIRGSRTATKLSQFFHDRDRLLRGKMSAAEFETKWRRVRIARQQVFADAATIFLRAHAGDLKVETLYASTGGAE